MKRLGDVKRMRGKRHACKFEWINLKEEDHFQDLDVVKKAGHVADMGTEELYTGFGRGNQRANNHLKDPEIDGGMITRWIFRKRDRYGSGLGQVAGTCKCDNKPSDSIK